MKTKLIGSAPTLEMLNEGINKYFYSEIELRKDESSEKWALYSSKGLIEGCYVVLKKKRYRFEMLLAA